LCALTVAPFAMPRPRSNSLEQLSVSARSVDFVETSPKGSMAEGEEAQDPEVVDYGGWEEMQDENGALRA
jgi:hypothetical protein